MSATCSIPDCVGVVLARSWCNRHWKRWSRHGDPLAGEPLRTSAAQRRVQIELAVAARCRDSCWLDHVGSDTSPARGGDRYQELGDTRLTHVVLDLDGRPRPHGALALHACDRPWCWNPGHLRWGTAAENTADMMLRGRANPPRGERSGKHKMTESEVTEARRRRALGVSVNELAVEYGIHPSAMSRTLRGLRWAHV